MVNVLVDIIVFCHDNVFAPVFPLFVWVLNLFGFHEREEG